MASTTAMDVLEELSSDSSEEQVQLRKPKKAKRGKGRPKKEKPAKKAKKERQEKAKPEKKPKKPEKDKQEKAKPKKKPEQENREQETPEQENPESEVQRCRSLRLRVKEEERRAARLIRRRKNSFAIYFLKVLKNIHVGLSLSQRSVNILDSFVKDMFERIASEASFLARQTKSSTINSREIQTAVRLLLPPELCRRAVAEGTMAMVRYISNK
ncbi:histone H2B type 1-A-like [Mus pahari]|uniref:histone H2B type 1-A-like n=1 Tax=Mus pahari TaxID=10093 RepID=UPI000A308A92|nr:histone H2B type 1-A-like [Mus pahari]